MKISIIGAGKVGIAVASHVLMKGLAKELVLVARDLKRAQGEAIDLAHTQALTPAPARVSAGDLEASKGSGILVLCASERLPPGTQDRLALGPANTKMLEELLPRLLRLSPGAIVIIASNPVDVLTWQALRITGLPPSRIFGTGTLLDSARFRRALSEELGIHPDDLRVYILGEHGDSQFPAMSAAMAGAEPISFTPARQRMFEETIASGLFIYSLKGNTNHGIGAATAVIIQSIVDDEKRTLPLSVRVDGFCGVRDVCLSLPVVVGSGGVEKVLIPSLNESEREAFRHSAAMVRKGIEACG